MDLTDNHTLDIHHIDWAVILVSWANFGPKEYALGELPGGDYPEIARVYASEGSRKRGFTPARFCNSKVQL